MRLTILIASAVTAGMVIYALFTTRNGVQVYSVDRQFKIRDAQYFSGTDFGYSYFTPDQKRKLAGIRFLRTLGLGRELWGRNAAPSPAMSFRGHTPALVLCGEIEDANSAYLDLLADNGKPYGEQAMPLTLGRLTNTFLWQFTLDRPDDPATRLHLTNGVYHIRRAGKTNDLGVVRVRL